MRFLAVWKRRYKAYGVTGFESRYVFPESVRAIGVIMYESEIMDKLNSLTKGAKITVRHTSKRSDEEYEKVGHVKQLRSTTDEYGHKMIRCAFQREDGHKMYFDSDGSLYTSGSHFPFVGTITRIEIEPVRNELEAARSEVSI